MWKRLIKGVALLLTVGLAFGACTLEPIDEIAVRNATSSTLIVVDHPCFQDANSYMKPFHPDTIAAFPHVLAGETKYIPNRGGTSRTLSTCLAVGREGGTDWYGATVAPDRLHLILEGDAGLHVVVGNDVGVRTQFDADNVPKAVVGIVILMAIGYALRVASAFWSGKMASEHFKV